MQRLMTVFLDYCTCLVQFFLQFKYFGIDTKHILLDKSSFVCSSCVSKTQIWHPLVAGIIMIPKLKLGAIQIVQQTQSTCSESAEVTFICLILSACIITLVIGNWKHFPVFK